MKKLYKKLFNLNLVD